MGKINPEADRELRKRQAIGAISMLGIDFLNEDDVIQAKRLLYVDDLTDDEFRRSCDYDWGHNKARCDEILIKLGYKPFEIFKDDVRHALVAELAKEYGEKFAKIKAENDKKAAMFAQAEKDAKRRSRVEANTAFCLSRDKARQSKGMKSIEEINAMLMSGGY